MIDPKATNILPSAEFGRLFPRVPDVEELVAMQSSDLPSYKNKKKRFNFFS